MLGQSFSRVVAREDLNRARTEFARKLLGESESGSGSGSGSDYELTILDAERRPMTVRISSAPLRQNGSIVGVFGLAYPLAGIAHRSADAAGGAHELTTRQFEVLVLLADGLGTAAIARRLGIAEETARNHIRALLQQLGAHSRLEAVVRAYRQGLLSPGDV